MSLRTGKHIYAGQWTELHVTDEVIRRVEELAEKEGIDKMVDGEPLSEWETDRPILPEYTVEEVTPPLGDVHMKNKGNVGHNINIFDDKDSRESRETVDTNDEEELETEEQEKDEELEHEDPTDEARKA